MSHTHTAARVAMASGPGRPMAQPHMQYAGKREQPQQEKVTA